MTGTDITVNINRSDMPVNNDELFIWIRVPLKDGTVEDVEMTKMTKMTKIWYTVKDITIDKTKPDHPTSIWIKMPLNPPINNNLTFNNNKNIDYSFYDYDINNINNINNTNPYNIKESDYKTYNKGGKTKSNRWKKWINHTIKKYK